MPTYRCIPDGCIGNLQISRQISHNKALFCTKVPAKALEHPGKPTFNIRVSGGQTPGCTENKHPGVQHQISLSC